jgi:hypothetical protein
VHFGGLPLQFDFVPVLQTLYHVATINGWCKNPMPSRIMVEPTCGEPPAKDPPPIDAKASAEAWAELRRRFKLAATAEVENVCLNPAGSHGSLNGKNPTANGQAPGGGVR